MIDRVSFFNNDARKTTALLERRTADARHTIRNRDAREAPAIVERIIADARHPFGDRDASEVAAIIERIPTDARHAVFDDYCFDAILITVPRHRGRERIIRHLPRTANRQHTGFSIQCPREIIPLCAAGAAIGRGRRRQNEKRR